MDKLEVISRINYYIEVILQILYKVLLRKSVSVNIEIREIKQEYSFIKK